MDIPADIAALSRHHPVLLATENNLGTAFGEEEVWRTPIRRFRTFPSYRLAGWQTFHASDSHSRVTLYEYQWGTNYSYKIVRAFRQSLPANDS